MSEKVLDVLARLGEECACYKHHTLKDVGRQFHCLEHGHVMITKVEVTDMGGDPVVHVITLSAYA